MSHHTQRIGTLLILLSVLPAGVAEEPQPRRQAESPFNFVLGTQTFDPKYKFSEETHLVETAQAIAALGSNLVKFDLSRRALQTYKLPANPKINTLRDMAAEEPSCRRVFDMPFDHYLVWAYPHSVRHSYYHSWRDGLSEREKENEYRELYDLAAYLLTRFSGTGKTFLLGHWEGDWALLGSFDPRQDPGMRAVQGMIDWLNTRQQAVDDAKRKTPCENVRVFHYTEVNLAQKAIQGGRTVTNDVLPHTTVDYVSYSSYDSLRLRGPEMRRQLHEALDHIESRMKRKAGPAGKRVFLGEYGFPLELTKSPEEQDLLSRSVARAALEWGCPYVLYWQMYCNEIRAGKHRGFWMIDEHNRQQPIYRTHRQFFDRAKRYLAEFRLAQGRSPTAGEFRQQAVRWLGEEARQTAEAPNHP
jgi:hypothetical protein